MFFIRLLSRLPMPALYLLSDFLFFFTFHVIRYRRKLVRRNLRNSFPEKSAEALKSIERSYYKNLCDYGVEVVKLLTISPEELKERMQFNGLDKLQEFADRKQSIMFLASHQFNWEWMLVAADLVFPFQIDFVYQPVNNKFFDDFILKCRTRFGAHAIRREDVGRELIRRKDIVRGLAAVSDQYPGYKKDKKFVLKFLNQDTVFFMGTNSMSILTQFPAIYYGPRKLKRGYYFAEIYIVGTPPYDKSSTTVLDNYASAVESVIRANPDGWLWSHNRWKKRHLTNGDES